jgi:hypothetical protein
VVTEIGSQTGWLSDEVRAEQSHGVRDLLQRCLHSDLDVLLPKMGSAGACRTLLRAGLTVRLRTSSFQAIKRNFDGIDRKIWSGWPEFRNL